ncbi:MAG: D-sedoheptulose 7-phosphate isomerase [Bdellovibrionales bacterium]|nr:D-sedoheptulose 7-phosphate isomerase [Bdellovibrionales bacterium]
MNSKIVQDINSSIEVKQRILEDSALISNIEKLAEKCIECYQNKNKVILAGNGGSAADAQHIAAEFVSRFELDRPGLPSIALNTDTSMITAIGNDFGYEKIFTRQLDANGNKGDVFIGISTSGNSKNIIDAVKFAKENGIFTVGFSGDSGKLNELSDLSIAVPSKRTARIQEAHIMIGHILCGIVESRLFQ